VAEPNPNYITPEGARRLTEELARLGGVDRPHIVKEVTEAAAQGDRSENAEYIYGKKKLREIDRRMRYLRKRLEIAVIVDPLKQKGNLKVFFGATVELEDEAGTQSTHQIVGEDEIDTKATKISWRSPIGRALLGKSEGDVITVRRPAGEIEIEIVSVRYV
jgi:transcription elongation factor GreB